MHVTERLKQDIRFFHRRMVRERLLNAGKWEPKTGELEERVRSLKERLALLNAKVRPIDASPRDKTETQVLRQEDQRNRSSERLRSRFAKKT